MLVLCWLLLQFEDIILKNQLEAFTIGRIVNILHLFFSFAFVKYVGSQDQRTFCNKDCYYLYFWLSQKVCA
jgi:hypothetical protein